MELLEVSDCIVDYDPHTLARRPVDRARLLDRLKAQGEREAARIVASLPERDGALDPDAVDALLIRVHCELQRLWEEFEHGPRLRGALRPLIEVCRAAGAPRPIRIVDVGCGLGFGVRWLANEGGLGEDVELVGVDYNAALVRYAGDLAAREGLACRFLVANAFELAEPATIFASTGVLHHFHGEALGSFFRAQARAGALGFVHFDLEPTWLTPIGAFIFHRARMRERLSEHDGRRSAARAHSGPTLIAAAQKAEGFSVALLDGAHSWLPILDIFHAVIGVQAPCEASLRAAFGPSQHRLGPFT